MKTIKNLTADELRKSILQLAIQGKLVKQNPDDEPASELVKKIYEEKKKLVAEGKIKKDKNESYIFKGDDNCYYEKIGKEIRNITDELPFEIPESWVWVRHNSFFEIFGGSQPPKSKFSKIPKDGYIRLYQIRDYGPNPDPIYIQIKDAHKITKKGDILLARYGASVGKVFWAENGAYNVAMAKVEKLYESDFIDFNYMYAFYKSPLYQLLVKNNSRSAQAGFNKNDLNELLLPIPPFEEQKRIVKKIQDFEPLIQQYEQREKLLSNLETSFEEKLKASILQYAIEGKLVKQDPDDEPASKLLERIKLEKERLIKEGKIKRDKHESKITLGDDKNYYENLPSRWVKTYIRNIISLTSGTDLTPEEYSPDNIGVPYLTGASNISEDNSIIINRYTNARYINSHKDEILLTCKGTIGKIAINQIGDIHVARQFMSIKSFILNDYMVIYLKTIVAGLNSEAKSMIPGIDRNQILTKEIILPPIQEQVRIANKVSELLFQISY